MLVGGWIFAVSSFPSSSSSANCRWASWGSQVGLVGKCKHQATRGVFGVPRVLIWGIEPRPRLWDLVHYLFGRENRLQLPAGMQDRSLHSPYNYHIDPLALLWSRMKNRRRNYNDRSAIFRSSWVRSFFFFESRWFFFRSARAQWKSNIFVVKTSCLSNDW